MRVLSWSFSAQTTHPDRAEPFGRWVRDRRLVGSSGHFRATPCSASLLLGHLGAPSCSSGCTSSSTCSTSQSVSSSNPMAAEGAGAGFPAPGSPPVPVIEEGEVEVMRPGPDGQPEAAAPAAPGAAQGEAGTSQSRTSAVEAPSTATPPLSVHGPPPVGVRPALVGPRPAARRGLEK